MDHVQEISSDAQAYVASACKRFDTPVKAVVKARVEGNEFVMLWDRGVNGVAKDRVLLSELKRTRKPKAASKTTPDLEK